MKLQNKTHTMIILFSILLFLFILYFSIGYLLEIQKNKVKNKGKEGFSSNNSNCSNCRNLCGPDSRCDVTGQQCFADMDCPGYNPRTPPYSKTSFMSEIPGTDDAGKLSNLGLQYSNLTTDFGSRSRIIIKDIHSKSPSADFGYNTWSNKFDIGRKLFDKRYKPHNLENMPTYPERYTVTGEFIDEGPIASNATF